MNGHRALFTIVTLAATCSAAGCDKPKIQPLGSVEITTTAPATEKDIPTTDGWTVKYDRFLVNVSAVTIAGSDGVVAASATPQIIDLVSPGTKSLLSETLRTARAWEDVSLEIGPAADDDEGVAIAPVTDADRETMAKAGVAIHIEGHLTGQGITKTFKWDFSTDTTYTDCQETQNGNVLHGLVVPPKGGDTADVMMSGEVLFSDDTAAGVLRAAPIAAADANNDGIVTLDELHATTLDAARSGGAPYTTGLDTTIADLGAFVEALVPRLVSRFRATGRCNVAPPATDTSAAP